MSKLPKIQDLYLDKEEAYKNDALQALLNSQPKQEWIKVHPFIKGYRYLPIDKIEFLLQKIFKKYRIEILREGVSFNGVYVVVRVHYLNPVTNEMEFHDGIGASQLQTAKGTTPAQLENINNGALSMAYPMAKTIAIKDACDHFGNLFGANLNRKDTLNYTIDESLKQDNADKKAFDRIIAHIEKSETIEQLQQVEKQANENGKLKAAYLLKEKNLIKHG